MFGLILIIIIWYSCLHAHGLQGCCNCHGRCQHRRHDPAIFPSLIPHITKPFLSLDYRIFFKMPLGVGTVPKGRVRNCTNSQRLAFANNFYKLLQRYVLADALYETASIMSRFPFFLGPIISSIQKRLYPVLPRLRKSLPKPVRRPLRP